MYVIELSLLSHLNFDFYSVARHNNIFKHFDKVDIRFETYHRKAEASQSDYSFVS